MPSFKITYTSGDTFEETLNDAETIEQYAAIKFGVNQLSDLPESVDKVEITDAPVVVQEPVKAAKATKK